MKVPGAKVLLLFQIHYGAGVNVHPRIGELLDLFICITKVDARYVDIWVREVTILRVVLRRVLRALTGLLCPLSNSISTLFICL